MSGLRPEDLRFDPPALAADLLGRALRELYGRDGRLSPLRGERDQNMLVTVDAGGRFVLKVSSPSEGLGTIEFQTAALQHLERCAPDLAVPRVVDTVDGAPIGRVEHQGRRLAVRLLTFLPGRTFDEPVVSLSTLRDVGALQGRVTDALADFRHPSSTAFMAWDIANGLIVDPNLLAIAGSPTRKLIDPLRDRLSAIDEGMRTLPRQVIHNDGHRGNVLRCGDSDQLAGLIDFGDLVHTVTAADLGISGAGFVGDQPDPVAALAALTEGFCRHRPLSDEEVAALPGLVLARLSLSSMLSEYQIRHTPHLADEIAKDLPQLHRDLNIWAAVDAVAAADRIMATLSETT